jgi:hypothetical protein
MADVQAAVNGIWAALAWAPLAGALVVLVVVSALTLRERASARAEELR